MGGRTPFVVGLLAIVAVVAWLFLRGDGAQPQPAAAPPPVTAPITAPGPSSPRPAAEQPSLPPPQAPTADDAFSEQPRDDAWARATEAELAKRWQQIRGGTLESTECKQHECRLIVTGTQDALAQAIADLSASPRGLHGYAKNVLLSSPTVAGDTVTLRIYVKFER